MEIKREPDLFDVIMKEECIEVTFDQSQNSCANVQVKEEVEQPYENVKEECMEENCEIAEKVICDELLKIEKRKETKTKTCQYSSSKCNFTISSETDLLQFGRANGEKRFNCDQCDYSTLFRRNLTDHKRINHMNIIYNCQFCDYSVKIKKCLKNHIMTYHENIRYICPECPMMFKSKNGVSRHIKVVHFKLRPFSCSKCNYATDRKSRLSAHTLAVHDNVRFTCDQCDFTASFKRTIANHEKSEHKNIRYNCHLCDYDARNKQGLMYHIDTYHENIRYTCAECQNVFKNKSIMSRHIKSVHLKIRPYSCSKCVYTTDRKSHLLKHTLAHDNVRYKCDQCDYTGSLKRHLEKHKRIRHKSIQNPVVPHEMSIFGHFMETISK